jgi:hypothetical protein
LGQEPPHLFAIAEAAFHSLLTDRCNQARAVLFLVHRSRCMLQ